MEKTKTPRLVTVTIITTITVIFWVFYSLYSILTSKPPYEVDPKLLIPLDPSLDTEVFRQLETTLFFEEGSFTPPPLTIQEKTKEELEASPSSEITEIENETESQPE